MSASFSLAMSRLSGADVGFGDQFVNTGYGTYAGTGNVDTHAAEQSGTGYDEHGQVKTSVRCFSRMLFQKNYKNIVLHFAVVTQPNIQSKFNNNLNQDNLKRSLVNGT